MLVRYNHSLNFVIVDTVKRYSKVKQFCFGLIEQTFPENELTEFNEFGSLN